MSAYAEPSGARPAPQVPPGGRAGGTASSEATLGELFGRLTSDLSTLMRQEVELAKTELKEEAAKAGKGAGLFGGAGIAGLFALVLLSFAAAWGLANVIPVGWAFLVVALVWGAVAAVMFVTGRDEIRKVRPVPDQTVETLKEDVRWAKHPTS